MKKIKQKPSNIPIKTPDEIEKMRAACKVTSEILKAVGEIVKPGICTEDINTFVHEMTVKQGCIPAPLHYKQFPKSVCTSINEVVCHGIPSRKDILKAGDIINIDVTTIKDGYFGDSSCMYFVGGRTACSAEAIKLVDVTLETLNYAISKVKPWMRVGDIGAAIVEYIKKSETGYGIVFEYTGHGIGRRFHEPPQVSHVGKKGDGDLIKPGMIFTIEPMINVGVPETVLDKGDNWTVRTADGKLSAQWEHTVLVTENGVEVLTYSW